MGSGNSVAETFAPESASLRGRSAVPRSAEADVPVLPGIRYASTCLIAARIGDHWTVPLLFEGVTCDTLAFNAWLEHQLCPLLDETHVVILDNAPFHKGSETARLIAQTGASLLFLPPYAPELNPIEKDFANIKRTRQYNPEVSIDQIIKMYN